jgi:hypothetical protein
MDRENQEELVQSVMTEMFTADENTFYPALYDSVDDYYSLLDNLNPSILEVVSSFIPAMENNTVVFATHMAMLEGTWVVSGNHVDYAKDILYDIFKNLILWLEDEVDIGPKMQVKSSNRNKWLKSYDSIQTIELSHRGEGWRAKTKMMKSYEIQNDCSPGSAYNNYDKWGRPMFDEAKDGRVVFVRLKESLEAKRDE